MVPPDGAGAAHGPPPDGQPHHGRALRGRRGREAHQGQQGWSVGRAVRGVAGAGDGGVASPAVETEVRGMGTFGVVVYIGCDLCVCRPVWRLVCNRGYILGCVGSEPEPGALPFCTEHETPHVCKTLHAVQNSAVVFRGCDGFGDQITSGSLKAAFVFL